jgi:hypothetical protein
MPFRAIAACAAGLAMAVQGAGQVPAAPRAPLELRCNFADAELQAAATAVIDDVWAEVDSWLGPAANAAASPVSPVARPTLFVWGDLASVKAATERAGRTPSRDLLGFVAADGSAGHVLLARAGWSRDEERRFAYVTASLVLAHRLAAQPACVRHGIAWLAVGEHALRRGRIEHRATVGYDRELLQEAQHLLNGERLAGCRELLRGLAESPPPAAERDARLVALFAAEEHPQAWRAALRAVADVPAPADDLAARLQQTIAATGGPAGDALDAQFRAWLARQAIRNDTEILVPDARGRPGDADFVPSTPSVHWLDRWDKPMRSLSAEVTLQQGDLQGDLLLERAGGRWLRITVLGATGTPATQGHVVVSERLPGPGNVARTQLTTADPKTWQSPTLPVAWRVLARADAVPGLVAMTPAKVEVLWQNGRLTVTVAGRTVLSTAVPATPVQRFGAGGPYFNHVAWRRIRIR